MPLPSFVFSEIIVGHQPLLSVTQKKDVLGWREEFFPPFIVVRSGFKDLSCHLKNFLMCKVQLKYPFN